MFPTPCSHAMGMDFIFSPWQLMVGLRNITLNISYWMRGLKDGPNTDTATTWKRREFGVAIYLALANIYPNPHSNEMGFTQLA